MESSNQTPKQRMDRSLPEEGEKVLLFYANGTPINCDDCPGGSHQTIWVFDGEIPFAGDPKGALLLHSAKCSRDQEFPDRKIISWGRPI